MAGKNDRPRRIVDALGDLDGAYLECRDLRHAWQVDHYTTSGRSEVVRVLACARCGTERVDNWTLGGGRVRAHYRYAEGYQLTGVEQSGDREAMRREVLLRAGIRSRRQAR